MSISMEIYLLDLEVSLSKFCFLTPDKNEDLIYKYYGEHIPFEECAFLPLYFDKSKKKTAIKDMKEFISEEIIPFIKEHNCQYLLVCDGEYFKLLAHKPKVEPYLGYVIDTHLGYVSYVPSYTNALYDTSLSHRIKQALSAVVAHSKGEYQEPGSKIIKTQVYPSSTEEIKTVLDSLYHCDKLTCDIETWSLKHYNSGIATITFCWNEHEGTAFCVDYSQNQRNEEVRDLLREFFENYQGTLIFHNITFDMYILTYQLYMSDLLDTEGLLHGLDVLLRNFEDTKIIAYLATNSCAGNILGLKALAQEFAGNYAQEEIANIDAIPREQLLQYNLIDGLSTWFVFNKYWQKMVDDEQLSIYQNLFKPAVKDIIQMQLTGLPLDMDRVLAAEKQMEDIKNDALNRIQSSPLVQDYMERYRIEWADKKNKEYKKKRVAAEDCKEVFNPDSSLMLKALLYDHIGLPIIERTLNKEPATGKDILAKLTLHTENQEVKDLLQALIDYKDVIKILTAFIPAFKNSPQASDGINYLYGNFNLGGCVSSRLSSSNVNLQQLPATGSKFAKLMKSCFVPPKGWLLVGLDYNALEAHIDALVTRDEAKLQIYKYDWDSHMWASIHYWPDKFHPEEIEKKDPKEIKEILEELKGKYKEDRSKSKRVSFALQYGGSTVTLEKNCGFSPEEAKSIYDNYHKLYKTSTKFKERAIQRAGEQGYITGAFGLRVRTPTLKRSVQGLKVTPREVEAEGRTAANAIMQSWCNLNTRSASEFMSIVRKSKYRENIKICAEVHDCTYFLVRDDVDVILWLNENLVKCVQWQDDPAIAHPDVHLGGELSIFWPDWSHECCVPNGCNREELLNLVDEFVSKEK